MSAPSPLVSAAWLAEHLRDPGVVVLDARFYLDGRKGSDAYAKGHVPGARFVDVEADLSGPIAAGPGRHPLPSAEKLAGVLARLGVGPSSLVVAYDDASGAMAARVWWLLRAFGHGGGRVLDGGLAAWLRAGGALEAGPAPEPEVATAKLALALDPARVVGRARVERASSTGDALLLDARAAERYEGKVEPIDARAGHVPGAVNAPFAGNLDPATGLFLPAADLARRYEALGAVGPGAAREVIAYCGSGVTACHDLLALELAGRPDAKLYEGSWSEWSRVPELGCAVGPYPPAPSP